MSYNPSVDNKLWLFPICSVRVNGGFFAFLEFTEVCIKESTKPHLCFELALLKISNRYHKCCHNLVFWLRWIIIKSFLMRHCMTLYLKGYQKYNKPKLKVKLLLSKFRLFNFDPSYLWYHLRYRVIQYLIGKLLNMVTMGQVALVVAALLASVRMSRIVTIY